MAKIFDILTYSLKVVAKFFIVVLLVYIMFAEVAMNLYGGCINEKSEKFYLEKTGGALNP